VRANDDVANNVAAHGGITSLLQSARLATAVAEFLSLSGYGVLS